MSTLQVEPDHESSIAVGGRYVAKVPMEARTSAADSSRGQLSRLLITSKSIVVRTFAQGRDRCQYSAGNATELQYNLVSWALNSFGVPLDDFLLGATKS